MKILITGGAGFIGSHTAEHLRELGNSVMVVDNFATGKYENIQNFLALGGKFIHRDVSIFQDVIQTFQDFKPDAVIHLAAQAAISTSMANPQHDLVINGIGTLNVIEAAKKFGARHFIFSSTSAVYREDKYFKMKESTPLEPKSPYGVSKLAAEMYARSLFPDAVVLRFGNVYGPRQVPIGENQVVAKMMSHFTRGDKFVINGSGKQERDYVYVTDVARALALSLHGERGTYNISSGKSISVNEIAHAVEEVFGVHGYAWEHNDQEDPRKHVCLEVGAAKNGLGWSATVGLREGIQKTVKWWEGRNIHD